MASGFKQGGRLSYASLEQLWIQAGGPRSLAPLMAAIALAESGGDPGATNPNDNGGTQTSWGLWQISLGNHNAPAPNWNDPLENARLAVGKYRSQGLGAWGTYTSGAYKQFYQGNVAPGSLPQGGGGGGGGGGTGGGGPVQLLSAGGTGIPPSWLPGLLSPALGILGNNPITATAAAAAEAAKLIDWLLIPSHWVRIFAGIGGAVSVGVGVITMTRAGKPYSLGSVGGVPVPAPGGAMAAPLGIVYVGVGSVLLFIAFHNVPSHVKTLPEFLGWLRQVVTQPGTVSGKQSSSSGGGSSSTGQSAPKPIQPQPVQIT